MNRVIIKEGESVHVKCLEWCQPISICQITEKHLNELTYCTFHPYSSLIKWTE